MNDYHETTKPFTSLALQFMTDSLDEMFEESVVFGDGEDLDEANKNLIVMVDDKFTSWQVSATRAMIDEVIDAYDVPYRMQNYFREAEENYVSHRPDQSRLEALDIDDLFSRDVR
jgi:hypothetical protein